MSAYSTSTAQFRARLLTGCAIAAASMGTAAQAQRAFQATPTNTINASVNQATGRDTVNITATQALIDWTPVDNAGTGTINILAAGDELRFQADALSVPEYTVLNRINPADPSRAVRIDGIVNSLVDTGYGISNGNIWFYTPGGIILGSNARVDVGSLVLTANAIQIGNLDTEGLFVGQDASATRGLIAFRAAPDSRSFVTVEAGAKINATSNYVALVAPRVTQAGAIKVNGTALMIASESADVTVPMAGNLFEVAVFGGSNVNAGGETTLEHTGTTQLAYGTPNGDPRAVYMVAVPKNDAITMLVSGTVGYEAATLPVNEAGTVVLLASTNASIRDNGNGRTDVTYGSVLPANTRIVDADILTRTDGGTGFLESYTRKLSIDAATSSTALGGVFTSYANKSTVTVGSGQSVTAERASFYSGGGVFDTERGFRMDIASGGAFDVSTRLFVNSSSGGGTGAPVPTTAGSIDIDVAGGQLLVGGDIMMEADGFGSTGSSPGEGTGGAIAIKVSGGGQLLAGGPIDIRAQGLGGESGYGAVAAGFGGSVALTAESGGSIESSSILLRSDGLGGSGSGGAAGTGGVTTLTIDGGSVEVGYGISLEATGTGGRGSGTGTSGGSGAGGTARLLVTGGGTVTANETISVNALGAGGGEAGYGTVVGGAGAGGIVVITAATGGIITADNLTGSAIAQGETASLGGGAAVGGDVTLGISGAASIDVNNLSLLADGNGGDTGNNNAGNGTGGDLAASVTSATLDADAIAFSARGLAGVSGGNSGGQGKGGTASLVLTGATLPGGNAISIDVIGAGGFGQVQGGNGTGGVTTLSVAGTDLVSSGTIELFAKGLGDYGNDGGGAGKGGTINIVAATGKIQAANLTADASGVGDEAFSTGDAGLGEGGAINLTSNAGGLIQGGSLFQAIGQGGDGNGPSNAANGTGGTITVRANGGTIDSVGRTIRFTADGIGGDNGDGGAAQAEARGGTVDLGVSADGLLSISSLIATADGLFDDQFDGVIINHGGAGIGGTVKLAMTGGVVTGSELSLSASGFGAVSGSGGQGGAAFQGRAEFTMSDGTVTLDELTVKALATGGPGIDQDGEGDVTPGDGGTAGLGLSPVVDSGAYASVSGGALSVITAVVDGSSAGGTGGQGEEFADVSLTGNGGDAVGGVASFTTSGTGAVGISALNVQASGKGGAGGGVLLFDSAGSDAVGGNGGAGTGGQATITFGGTGPISLLNVLGDAGGLGGEGGSVRDFFGSKIFGSGIGGIGGNGAGGSVLITANTELDDFAFVAGFATGFGGDGGLGPRGGAGGNGTGGDAIIAVNAGNAFYAGLQVFADGGGGSGADGLSSDGGDGGIGLGGAAVVTVGGSADILVGSLEVGARGSGGDGGFGADGSSNGFNGGDGGAGVGGEATISALGGRMRVPGSSEAPPVGIGADGAGGDGGTGGTAAEGIDGAGGNGGGAQGGTASITSVGGDLDFFFTVGNASGTGGGRGAAGGGFDGTVGNPGFGAGGAVKINVDQTSAPNSAVRLGSAQLDASGSAFNEDVAPSASGYISFDVKGTSSGGALQIDELEANALGLVTPEDRPSGIKVRGAGSPITIAGDASLSALGAIDFGFTGDSGLRATGDVVLATASEITLAHGGQAPGGSFASIAGRDVIANAGSIFDAAATSRIDASSDLDVTADGGFASLGSGTVGGSVSVDSADDISLGAGAQLIADRSVVFRSADDIVIGTGALLRAANDPPAESGYGATDPLQQQTQLKLYAGALFSGEGSSGDVRSLILNGDVQSPNRTMQLEAGAIQAADNTTLSGGNLYVRKLGTTPAEPSDDFGQLSAPCLQGSVCLANVAFNGIVQIGGSGFAPTNLRISGDLTGGSVFAGATDTVRLGREGATSTIGALADLTIDARDGDILGFGTIDLTGGSQVVNLYAGGAIDAPGLNVTAPAGFDLVSGSDVILGNVTASLIRTRNQSLGVVNPSGITADGLIQLASVQTASDLLLDGQNGVFLGAATITDNKSLTVLSGADTSLGTSSAGKISVTSIGTFTADDLTATAGDIDIDSVNGDIVVPRMSADGGIDLRAAQGIIAVTNDIQSSAGITAEAKEVTLIAVSGLNVLSAKATGGNLVMTSSNGDLEAGTSSASGSITLDSIGTLAFDSLSAGAGTEARADGPIIGGTVSAGTSANLTSFDAITLDSLAAQTSTLTANEAIKVANVLSVPGGITATGGSVDLNASDALKINLAEAASGDVTFVAAGDIEAAQVRASGAANLSSANGDVSVADLQATDGTIVGDAVDLASSGDLTASSVIARTGDLAVDGSGAVAIGVAQAGGAIEIAGDTGVSVADARSSQTLKLTSSGGAIAAASSLSASGFEAVGKSVTLTGAGSLTATVQATGGDAILLSLAGPLSVGGTATGAFQGNSAAALSTKGITAGGALALAAKGDISGGADLIGSSVTIQTPGRLDQILFLRASDGPISVIADNGISAGGFISSGAIDLRASNGLIVTSTPTVIGTEVMAIGKSVTLINTGSLNISRAEATAGVLNLGSQAGSLNAGTIKASNGITLTADAGAITVADAASPIQLAMAKSIAIGSTTDLAVAFASASDGDLSLAASSGAVDFKTLSASKALTIAAGKDVTGGSATAGSIAISTPASVTADDLVATAGTLSVIADKGITLDTAASSGTTTLKAAQGVVTVATDIRPDGGLIVNAPTIDLTAKDNFSILQAVTTGGDLKLTSTAGNLTAGSLSSAGALTLTALAGRIDVTNDLTAAGPIQATAQAMSLTAANDLIVSNAQATGGAIVLTSREGNIGLGNASATGALSAVTPGLLTLTGSASGSTIAFTSNDIAIGSNARLGSKTATTALALTSTADRMFIGDATGTGYRLDTGELGRLASKGDISLVSAPQTRQDESFDLLNPNNTNIVVGALTFDGAQLGSNGTLRVESPTAIGFIGNSQFKNFTDGQTVTFATNGDISLAAETGLVTLKNGNGGLAGTLRLEAQQVHAMSTAKRSEIAGLELNAAKQRLGTNDQVNNQGGYFQAGNIVVNIGRLLFIQNSGENGDDLDKRAGLTANNLTISSGEGEVQVVLNGQVNGATGAALRTNVTLNGDIDSSSAFNGCSIGDATCGSGPIPEPEPMFDATPVVSSARDQIEDDEEEDEKEEALQASQTRPDPIIQFMTSPSSRFDPLIDEPVTGAGNEDFWETPTLPTPGRP